MSPEERRRSAFEQLDELIGDGVALEDAIATAAESNELKVEHFRAFAEKHQGDLEKYREKILLRTRQARVAALARYEIAKCQRREGPYKSLNIFRGGAEEIITDQVQAALGSALTEHDCWTIEDMWDEVSTAGAPERRALWQRLREWKRSRT